MALPTKGRVIIETTAGEIEIELWAKETPKTCRNFIALSMEGYYDNVIFHRIVPNFLIQTGDRTGTGGGGESFYGDAFEDEIHPRLKFVHRGLVGMANKGEKDTNDSQFFITLDRADELNGKHTLFGRVVGNTVFNALKIGESEIGKDERPKYPPKIRSVRIVDNPFDDIVPRITAAEKQAQKKAREQATREREEAARRKGGKKNVGLLSFADGAGEGEEEAPVIFKKKPMVRPDLIDPGEDVTAVPAMPQPPSSSSSKRAREPEPSSSLSRAEGGSKKESASILEMRERHEKEKSTGSTARQAEIAKMEADIKRLARKKDGDTHSDDDDNHHPGSKKAKTGPSALELERAKYLKKGRSAPGKGKGSKKDDGELWARIEKFQGKLRERHVSPSPREETSRGEHEGGGEGEDGEDEGEGEGEGQDVDNDTDWMSHRLSFPKGNEEEVRRAEHDYEVIDPRTRGAAAQQAERDRRQAKKSNVGSAFRRGR